MKTGRAVVIATCLIASAICCSSVNQTAPQSGNEEDNVPVDLAESSSTESEEPSRPPERHVILEDLDGRHFTEASLQPGDPVFLNTLHTPHVFSLIYREGDTIAYRRVGETIEVNGEIVGMILYNRPDSVSRAIVNRYRGQLRTIIIVGSGELNPQVAQNVVEMAGKHLCLTVELAGVDNPRLDLLRGLGSKLENLRLRGFQFSDVSLAHVSAFTNLRILYLYPTSVSDGGLAHLSGMTHLESLILPRFVTDAGLPHISELPNLRHLNLPNRVTDYGLLPLSSLENLEELRVSSNVTDAGMARLSSHEGLRNLDLSYSQVTDSGLLALSGFENLEELSLSGTQVTDSGLAHLTNLENLRTLGLGSTQISDGGLARLSNLRELERLYLSETQVGDAGLAHLSGLVQLRGLSLWNTGVTDVGLAHLSGLVQLRILNIRGTQVSDAGFASLSGLPELRVIYLWGTQISDESSNAFIRDHGKVRIHP